ncbi:MAG: apolipoprotein N-acyltransferase [Hydrogenovibrio sp.]|uniref:apolipoprotein N-acyltransferase n=1 Tax=Hydrogenovibrio sp. TaxID=2065821 RepID=UPI00286FB6C1|nr:apolipoprotein N-acyltransferase [Hydrogenovibrio sp.]MDR9499310.1 apolipoprotein N-acyltransferase [Hydrogenovibrio sp.]
MKFLAFFRPKRQDAALFGLGGLMVFAHAPIGIAPLALIALMGLFWFWQQAPTVTRAVQQGMWFGFGFFGIGVSWLISSIYLYAEVPLPLAVLAVLIFIGFLSLYFMLAGALVGWLRRPVEGQFDQAWYWLGLMPAIWVLAELIRGSLFGGFPFLVTGNSHLYTSLSGYVPVIGAMGVSWLVALTAGLLLWLFKTRGWVLASAALVLIWGGGFLLDRVTWVTPKGQPVDIALLQGNVPQDQKWQGDQLRPTLERYVSMTRENMNADLVVWPETAVPGYFDVVERGALRSFIRDAQLLEKTILMGVIRRDGANDAYFNSIVNAGNPEQFYDKRHLVPFSEFFPFYDLLSVISGWFDIPFSEFTAGGIGQKPLQLGEHKVALSVCYEMAFGTELAPGARDADFLVTVSNDAWFAHTLEPAQQMQDAQMRALELGREIARATNTGYTAIVGVDGLVREQLPLYEPGVLREKIQPYQGETPFVRWGHTPLWLGTLLVLLIGIGWRFRRSVDSQPGRKQSQ